MFSGRSEQQPSSAQKMEQLQKQITASQQRSVASSERTLQLIQDSESIGIETANVSLSIETRYALIVIAVNSK